MILLPSFLVYAEMLYCYTAVYNSTLVLQEVFELANHFLRGQSGSPTLKGECHPRASTQETWSNMPYQCQGEHSGNMEQHAYQCQGEYSGNMEQHAPSRAGEHSGNMEQHAPSRPS